MAKLGRSTLLITVWNHSKVRSKILTNSSYSSVGQRLLLKILPNFLSLSYSTKSNIIFFFFGPYAFNSFLIYLSLPPSDWHSRPHIHIYKLQLMVLERKVTCFLVHSLRFISEGTAPPVTPLPWEEGSLLSLSLQTEIFP